MLQTDLRPRDGSGALGKGIEVTPEVTAEKSLHQTPRPGGAFIVAGLLPCAMHLQSLGPQGCPAELSSQVRSPFLLHKVAAGSAHGC